MNNKKFVIFIDLKDFTYKNALLTDMQIEEILTAFEDIVVASADKYGLTIVKSIGDAYLVLWERGDNAFAFSQEILTESRKYDKEQKIEIKKIGLRVTMTFWTVTKKESMKLDDYFGESINLWSRMMSVTPKSAIFCTKEVVDMLKTTKWVTPIEVGEFPFHGILTDTLIYALTDVSKQEIQEILKYGQSPKTTILQECDEIVFRSSCVAALLSLQPIPLLDSYNILCVHLYMILKLSGKFGRRVSLNSGSKIFVEIISPLSLSYVSLQGASAATKILLPGIGWYIIAPLSFAVSYALWKVYTAYFFYDRAGQKMNTTQIRDLFFKQKDEWKKIGKSQKKEIFITGKKFYKDILSVKTEAWFSKVKNDILSILKKKK